MVAVVLSGFFALTGSALRTFRRAKLEEAFAGKKAKARLEYLAQHLRSLQLTSSFGRAIGNLLLVVAVLYLFDPAHEGYRAVYATAIAGAIIAVVGVGIPHAWARHGGERALAVCLRPLVFFRYVFYPVVVVMGALDVPVRRLAGVAEEGEDELTEAAKREILQAASDGRAEGAVGAQEVQMIASVMELGEMQAREIMTPRTDIFALPVELACGEAAGKVVQAAHSRVPIYDGDLDNIVGVLYAKDLLSVLEGARDQAVRTVMRKPFFVPETKRIDDLLAEFKARKVHIAVVLDEYGGTAGLVSIEDVMEEIVGEISDEYDRTAPALVNRLDERTAEVDGRVRIDELNEQMHLRIPENQDYDTVAGMIFAELGYIPAVGEKLQAHGGEFAILAADERKITKVKVVVPGKVKAGGEG